VRIKFKDSGLLNKKKTKGDLVSRR